MDAEQADIMRDTVAFMRARFDNDFEAAAVLLEANEAGIIVGLVDINLAYSKLLSDMLGIPVEHLLKTMTTVSGWMTEGVR